MSYQLMRFSSATALILAAFSTIHAQEESTPVLMRVIMKSSKVMIGQVIENLPDRVRFYDLVTNAETEIEKRRA